MVYVKVELDKVEKVNTSQRIKEQLGGRCSNIYNYIRDLNNGLVWFSIGRKNSDCQMVT